MFLKRKNIQNYLRTLILAFGLAFSIHSQATTYYSVSNGNWTGNIWSSSCSTCAGGALPTLVDGDILQIDDHVTVNTQISITADIIINLISNSMAGAQLNFNNGKKLSLSDNSVINLSNTNPGTFPDPQINAGSGGGNSNYIQIGGNTVWNAGDPDISGTGQLNKNSSSGVLPVELLFFKASVTNGSVKLEWATASELNFDYFAVERSLDGKDFQEIDRVVGHGTTKKRNDYVYYDLQPLAAKLYYRLRTVDFDGYEEYFNIASVDFGGDKRVTLYPNPISNGNLGIQMNFIPTTDTEVVITDMVGAQKLRKVFYSDENQFSLPIALETGTYLVRLKSGDFSSVSRIMVK